LVSHATSHDDFFLIYEYAHKVSLSSHLHDTQNKGKIAPAANLL